jgi:two-component system, CAI-1 autoinducer sensor kinase/phosphatase CqsS
MNNSNRVKFYIIFIDDEEKSVKYFKKIFGEKFNVIATTSHKEVLDIIDSGIHEVAIVVSDQKMPNSSGVDLLSKIREKNSNIVRILTTAYASLEDNIDAINRGNIFAYLTKPWNVQEAESLFYKAFAEFEAKKNYLGLSSSIAHEMRNPLSNVRQSTKLAKEKLSSAHLNEKVCGLDPQRITPLTKQDFKEIIDSLNIAENSAKRGNTIIDLILNNISGKNIDVRDFKDLSASSIIKKFMSEYAFKNHEKERIKIDVKLGQDFIIRCEETALIYVFFNLLRNSLYYLNSYPNFNIIVRSEIGDDDFNRIYFRDNGPGIAQNKLADLFGFFSTSGKKEGTGLGLSFCKRAMQSFGGDILCNSIVGEFSEFVLTFPKIKQIIPSELSEETSNRILLVDDQETSLSILKLLLEKKLHSLSCDKALSGLQAIEMAKTIKYDLIVMDILMPEMDGNTVTKEIRKFNQNIPIIAYSSKDLDEVIGNLKQLGFNDFIEKSASDLEILKMISKWGVIKFSDPLKNNGVAESLKNKKILIADDEEVNLKITAKYFTSLQANVTQAKDGSEVLEMIKNNSYDLILMDINMPNIDGIAAIKEIRKFQHENNLKRTSIIAITGDNSKEKIFKILNAGFDDYFIKGNDYDDLSNIIAFLQ